MTMSERAQKDSQGTLCAKNKVYLRENVNMLMLITRLTNDQPIVESGQKFG